MNSRNRGEAEGELAAVGITAKEQLEAEYKDEERKRKGVTAERLAASGRACVYVCALVVLVTPRACTLTPAGKKRIERAFTHRAPFACAAHTHILIHASIYVSVLRLLPLSIDARQLPCARGCVYGGIHEKHPVKTFEKF